jgi:D-alanyl-lipoteichoic acid acyltransferase DltB (MBOAT superfamily)
MHFVSLEWLFLMVLCVGVYWWLRPSWRDAWLLSLASAVLFWLDSLSMLLSLVLAVAVYTLNRQSRVRASHLLLAIALMIALLAYYKLERQSNGDDYLAMPLGLSFTIFRCIHVLVDRFSGRLSMLNARSLACYLFFLPTLVIGPIHRAQEFTRDHERLRFDSPAIARGLERIVYGYAKITILGNFIVGKVGANWVLANSEENTVLRLYLEMVQNGLNLYFQFAGFSDIAIGFALLLGYKIAENFNNPYLAPNISLFWQRWHMSLSSWCRDYVNTLVLSFTRSPALAALATMLAIGLWHSISLKYLAWGVFHALGLISWQAYQSRKHRLKAIVIQVLPVLEDSVVDRVWHGLCIVITVHFVWLSFLIVNDQSLKKIALFYQSLPKLF